MKWMNPKEAPFRTYGLAFFDTDDTYRRFKVNPPKELPSAVNSLSNCPAGGQVRFRAKLRELQIKVTLSKSAYMSHMPPTGHSGFDCYLMRPGIDKEPLYYSTAFPKGETEYTHTLITIPEAVEFEVTLNLPLYNSVKEFSLGFDDEAVVSEGAPFDGGKIVVYGGSIDQGGCANRPGMAYTNILSRWLNREFINLGFSGNGKAEEEVAVSIAEIDGVDMFIINTAGNCPDDVWLKERMPRFIEVLRERYPDVPILIWQLADFTKLAYDKPAHDIFYAKLAVEEWVYNTRRAAGDNNIHIARMEYTDSFMGHDLSRETTVDGVHPTDLGFAETAKKLYPIITKLLNINK
nr:SGNH/GDSL hydrolase family protein [Clostridia bacterium]